MSQHEIDYNELEQEFKDSLTDLGREDLGTERSILATSIDNRTTARRMRLLSDGFTLYGWTNLYTRKAHQIMTNPKVSVVVDYLQIDGTASLKGHPTENQEFLKVIKRKLPHRYDSLVGNWGSKDDRVVIEVNPSRIALWKYDDPELGIVGGLYILDLFGKKAYRLDYDSITANDEDAPAYRK